MDGGGRVRIGGTRAVGSILGGRVGMPVGGTVGGEVGGRLGRIDSSMGARLSGLIHRCE